ncbi:Glycosyl hydrolases family 43 [Cyclobacterium lianum]|uniref:Glycosyl hydrolases family 43 n=1 Tax=Cyclobacterium lianum TaxID=388280 RepID=A0A1M7PLZ5_9BACT|nr:glycoside hydrolase family 43 protein [Cyclobacterium lianum]SHN18303.1 Glycosyl hydrolases family 43 [Cyclobacterium lianum]
MLHFGKSVKNSWKKVARTSYIVFRIPDPTDTSIYLADPSIFYHEGSYYLYGTSGMNADLGFEVYVSKDLEKWEKPKGAHDGYALKREDVFGDKGFWAPQVVEKNGRFYMAYTANENIAIAEAAHPLGPFEQSEKVPLAASVKQIDPFIFKDDNRKYYLYHVRLMDGNRLFVAELAPDFSRIKKETLTQCIVAEEGWENTQNEAWPVAEGPTIIKHKELYYFLYSANDFRNPDYAVGYAVSGSPYGPWNKHRGNPILSREMTGHNGTGHGDVFYDKEGKLHYVMHTHFGPDAVAPRRTALVSLEMVPAIGQKAEKLNHVTGSFHFLKKTEK